MMVKAHLVTGMDRNSTFARTKRHEASRLDDKITKVCLRDSLAREATLHRQLDELIQRNEILRDFLEGGKDAANRVASLTPREREVMRRLVAGHPNKNIAVDLGVSRRTVENRRASIMKKTGLKSLPALARLALAAAWSGVPESKSTVVMFATAEQAEERRSAAGRHDRGYPNGYSADAGQTERPRTEPTWRKRS